MTEDLKRPTIQRLGYLGALRVAREHYLPERGDWRQALQDSCMLDIMPYVNNDEVRAALTLRWFHIAELGEGFYRNGEQEIIDFTRILNACEGKLPLELVWRRR